MRLLRAASALASPVAEADFDEVRNVSDLVRLAGKNGDFEFSIPLQVLGLAAREGLTVRGDVGVLRGNGAQTIQRIYWSNPDTAIVSDVPSEARLQPSNWGTLRLGASRPKSRAAPAGGVQGRTTDLFHKRSVVLLLLACSNPQCPQTSFIHSTGAAATGKFAIYYHRRNRVDAVTLRQVTALLRRATFAQVINLDFTVRASHRFNELYSIVAQ